MCFYSQSGGGASIGVLTWQIQSCDLGRRAIMFVRFAMKITIQNDRDFVNVFLLYLLPGLGDEDVRGF